MNIHIPNRTIHLPIRMVNATTGEEINFSPHSILKGITVNGEYHKVTPFNSEQEKNTKKNK